jgi:parallel beta-helix repeat protein
MSKMKAQNPILLSAILLTVCLSANAATYYVSSFSGNDSYNYIQAQSQSTPWRSIAKINSIFGGLNPGDQVLLEAGSVFTGPLLVTKSGIAGHPITISVYGSGAMPIISGFQTLSGWAYIGSGIWQAPCAGGLGGLKVNMVAIQGVSTPMGRYPNIGTADGGYLKVQSFNGLTSITDSHLAGSNWTGANLVLRKNRWVTENDPITYQGGNTLNYISSSPNAPTVNFGYFIQNSIKTLDENGEWFYDAVNKKIDLYSTASPTASTIQAAVVDTLVYLTNVTYVVINGINFQGANYTAIALYNASFVTVQNCDISNTGVDAIDIFRSSYNTINSVAVDHTNNDAIFITSGNGNMIENCVITRTGTIPGAGLALSSYQAVTIQGNNNTLQYTTIDTTGYSAVAFMGSSNNIAYNFLNYYCFVKDDGGGIYTWSGNLDSTSTNVTGWITSNIVANGITCPAGTDSLQQGIAIGIYLDVNSTKCDIVGNTVTKTSGGIFYQDSRNITVENNTLFDNRAQLLVRHLTGTGYLANNNVTGNIAASNANTEFITEMSSLGPVSAITTFGYFHNNRYAQVASGSTFYNFAFQGLNTTGNFGSWQSVYDLDYSSALLPMTFNPYTINSLIGGDKVTQASLITPFTASATGTRVVASDPCGTIQSGVYYVAKFAMSAPDAAHTMLVFVDGALPPYPLMTPVVSVPTSVGTANNTAVFQTSAATTDGSLKFQVQNTEPGIAVTDITLYQATVTINNPSGNVIFQYNPSRSSLSVGLAGGTTYQDLWGNIYTGTATVPAYGSILLIKKT